MNLTSHARALRADSTPAEREVWRWLRNRYLHGYKFRRQHPVGRFILDFYCPQLKLSIELDGRRHNTEAGAARDEARSRELARLGVTVLRFWNDDVRQQPTACWYVIVETVEKLHPSP
jgi:very-short-patch-repair endonuclease